MAARIIRNVAALAVLSAFLVSSGGAQNKKLLTTAKTASLLTDVTWNKERKFNSTIELNHLNAYISQTPLAKRYRVTSSGPDIILKFHEDVFTIGAEIISLTAFDPEDNSIVWSEERPMVDAQNDVVKLVGHFLKAVDQEVRAEQQEKVWAEAEAKRAKESAEEEAESTRRRTEERAKRAQAERENAAEITWKRVGSSSGAEIKAWIQKDHLYEASEVRRGNIVRSTYCDTVRGGTAALGPSGLYAGTCTYTIKWVQDYGAVTPGYEVKTTCSVITAEVITSVTPTRIEGWSQHLDSSPLKNSPPGCPIAGTDGKEFAYEK